MDKTPSGQNLMGPRPTEKKIFHVQEATNGYVITLAYAEMHIAQGKEEVLKIIGEYIDRPKQ